jgi:hypothetical protein
MTRIATTHYRPKRASPKKRKQPAPSTAIVTPAKVKRGPPKRVMRLSEQEANDSGQEQPQRTVIVEPRGKRGPLATT